MPPTEKRIEVIDGIEVEVLEFSDTVETVDKASMLSGYPPEVIAKTILLKVDNNYLIAIVRGDRRIDYKKASSLLGGRVKLADPNVVKQVLGVEVGAVTPLSPRVRQLPVIVDPLITQHEYVVCGGGALNKLYRVKVRDLLEYLNPRIVDVFK